MKTPLHPYRCLRMFIYCLMWRSVQTVMFMEDIFCALRVFFRRFFAEKNNSDFVLFDLWFITLSFQLSLRIWWSIILRCFSFEHFSFFRFTLSKEKYLIAMCFFPYTKAMFQVPTCSNVFADESVQLCQFKSIMVSKMKITGQLKATQIIERW